MAGKTGMPHEASAIVARKYGSEPNASSNPLDELRIVRRWSSRIQVADGRRLVGIHFKVSSEGYIPHRQTPHFLIGTVWKDWQCFETQRNGALRCGR